MTIDERTSLGGWSFEGFGPEFDNHVSAHLPGYADVQRLVAHYASYVVPPGGTVADYGASTGRTAYEIDRYLGRYITYWLYDADASMLETSEHRSIRGRVERRVVTLPEETGEHTDADLTLLLWTLQFLPETRWREALAGLRARSASTGYLLLATKTRYRDPVIEEIAVGALDDYKAEAGVDAAARAAKTASLRGTMYPADLVRLSDHVRAAGWSRPTLVWRWHSWALLVASADPRSPGDPVDVLG